MDQLSAMRVFTRVVETGNFSRAATALNMPKTTVTNMVQALEAHLHTTLLNRTTRRVMLTTDGALYYERASQILSEIEELDGSMSSAQVQPSGRLRVEMAGVFADLGLLSHIFANFTSVIRKSVSISVSVTVWSIISRRMSTVRCGSACCAISR